MYILTKFQASSVILTSFRQGVIPPPVTEKQNPKNPTQIRVKWFSDNKMIVNLDKFKSIIIQKTNQTIKPKTVFNKKRRCKNRIDGQLNLNLHISNICKSVSKQLNAFVRLKCFLAFEERNVLINSLVLSSFNYCPLVWSIS